MTDIMLNRCRTLTRAMSLVSCLLLAPASQAVNTPNTVSVANLQHRAEQGIVEAQYRLGWSYAMGVGVEQDYQQALAWYRKAAEQGPAAAQCNLWRI